uniref:Transmembrane protein 220 n=1 Tax=Strigamia maritima TaxID=126957 RepID=T1ISY2_STRMM
MEGRQLIVWKFVNILMFLFFLLATLVQFNDDDACVWIPVYVIPAALSLAIVIKPKITSDSMWLTVTHVHTACCICIFAYIVALLLQNMHKESFLLERKLNAKQQVHWNLLYYEEGRELVGLILVLIWLKISKTVMTPGSTLQKSRYLIGLIA